MRASNLNIANHRPAEGVDAILLVKLKNFSGLVKDGFKFIEEFKKKTVKILKPKKMTTFKSIFGVATALWFTQETFATWDALEEAFKKCGA